MTDAPLITPAGPRSSDDVATPIRLAAAAAVLVGGLVHLQLYFDGYKDVPNDNFGRSFIANGVASTLIAAALVLRRDVLLRLAGIAVSVGTLIAFAMSRTDSGIFGFSEEGLDPSPQAIITLVTEIAAIVLLAATFLPKLGAGRELPIRLAAPVAGVLLVGTAVMSVLWSQDDGTAPVAGPSTVAIVDFAFAPPELTVAAGTSVTWTNQDSFPHTATGANGAFNSGNLATGQSFEFAFDTAGTFTYICAIHPSMAGTIVVTP